MHFGSVSIYYPTLLLLLTCVSLLGLGGCGKRAPISPLTSSSLHQPQKGVHITVRYHRSKVGEQLEVSLVNHTTRTVYVPHAVDGYKAKMLPLTYRGRSKEALLVFALVPMPHDSLVHGREKSVLFTCLSPGARREFAVTLRPNLFEDTAFGPGVADLTIGDLHGSPNKYGKLEVGRVTAVIGYFEEDIMAAYRSSLAPELLSRAVTEHGIWVAEKHLLPTALLDGDQFIRSRMHNVVMTDGKAQTVAPAHLQRFLSGTVDIPARWMFYDNAGF